MENSIFKSVAFGGFDKQDVIRYIEQAAREASDAQEKASPGERGPADRGGDPAGQGPGAGGTARTETSARQTAQSELDRERTARKSLEDARAEADRLSAEIQRLRPEAEAYAQFRDRVGDIECDAHKRAAELEASTLTKLRRTMELFRAQYTELKSTFATSSDHVTAELRKMEVALAQLPRAMDRPGAELGELAALLSGSQRRKRSERSAGPIPAFSLSGGSVPHRSRCFMER